jgi:GNAT superfamily N-acetyltransferase
VSGLELRWSRPGEAVPELVAQRRAIYGGELGWLGDHSDAAWDRYDGYSTALLVYDGGALVASGRLTIETDGPSELSELVAWRSALPQAWADRTSAEWSRVMIAPRHRAHGLFRRMYAATLAAARARGVGLLSGASVTALKPHYEKLGFCYLEMPFRSPFFDESPIYYPAYQSIE